MNRERIEFFHRASIFTYFFFLAMQVVGFFLLDNAFQKNLLSLICVIMVLGSWWFRQWSRKKIVEFREDDFLGDVPALLSFLFLKYDFYRFKKRDFVESYFKQELFDEINNLKAKHKIETKYQNFLYNIDDERYNANNLDVVIETTLLEFTLILHPKNISSKMFRVQKQANALSIS